MRTLKALPQFEDLVVLQLSPDGREVLALTDDSLWRYDVETNQAVKVTRPHGRTGAEASSFWASTPRSDGGALALSPDGRYIAGYDGALTIYDARTGIVVRRMPLKSTSEFAFRDRFHAWWSPDGHTVLAEGLAPPGVHAFSWPSCKLIRSYDLYGSNDGLMEAEIATRSSGLHYFATQEGEEVSIRDSESLKVLGRTKGTQINADPGRPFVASPSGDAVFFCFENSPKRSDFRTHLWRWPTTPE